MSVLHDGVRLTVIKFSVESEPIPRYRSSGPGMLLARGLTILAPGLGVLVANIIVKYTLLMEIQRSNLLSGWFLFPYATTNPLPSPWAKIHLVQREGKPSKTP